MGTGYSAELNARNANGEFVGAFVDELALSGVRHVALCPGSRSTPLALPAWHHPEVTVWRHLDERSAAFFALGMAKALREPIAIVSTSGTAAVNFAPAVVEACYARVPLLVLTADRPPELRDVGANQTIDQVRLYGSHTKMFVDVPLPEASDEAVRYARTLACRAVATARADGGGPVHLNFPFREPLAGSGRPRLARDGSRAAEPPYVSVQQAPRAPEPATVTELAEALGRTRNGLIVCGPQDEPTFAAQVARLAARLDFPLLADPLSQVRCGPHVGPFAIDSYDAFLRDPATAEELAPDIVLRFGATPTSQTLQRYLQHHAGCRQVLIDEGDGWNDPSLVASDMLRASPSLLAEALLGVLQPSNASSAGSGWTTRWRELSMRTRETLTERLNAGTELSEPRVFVELAELLPAGATLFAGNSMPVRDLDAFFPSSERPIRFFANRGASGIDGVISTALGVSAADAGPVVLVIGDLSFYHDMNGLLAAKLHQLQATIVLINNDGGGIFSLLPPAAEPEVFEELFGGPHGLDFRPVAELYGLAYRTVGGRDDFRAAVDDAFGSPGVSIVEVRTEREANAGLHRDLWAEVGRSLGATAVGWERP